MDQSETDEQDKRAEQQTEERRHYSVQMLAEKYPRMTSLYFFGFGIWAVLVIIGYLLSSTPPGLLSDAIPYALLAAGYVVFKVLSMQLSLLALWGKFSRAKSRARNEQPVPASQEAPVERAIQRFVGRHPRIASAYLYGYGISSVTLMTCGFLPKLFALHEYLFVKTQLCFMLLSVPVAILAFCFLRKNKG